jgi:hypothetical protein
LKFTPVRQFAGYRLVGLRWPLFFVSVRTGIGLKAGFFRISNGSGNDVAAAGPLAQIYETAALAAEGELGIRAHYQLLAGGATQAENSLTGHGTIR